MQNCSCLTDRIAEARVVDPKEQPQGEMMFGAIVTLKTAFSGKNQDFQIVGVDEGDIAREKISFLSPLAKALINKKVGDKITLKRDREEIAYENHEYILPLILISVAQFSESALFDRRFFQRQYDTARLKWQDH
ncbi:MAG: GreA/GreB family elongation factor [Bacteroidales bacterium]|nr:GreA/GreB family elongation factor [Bacteroidales bacterium]